MPDISYESRYTLEPDLSELIYLLKEAQPGMLTYVICEILLSTAHPAENYAHLATAVGILETAKLELYRRIGARMEDRAIERNGDTLGFSLCETRVDRR